MNKTWHMYVHTNIIITRHIVCFRDKDQQKYSKHLLNIMCFLIFQVYKVCSDTFDSYDQHYGRGLVKDTIKDGMCACVCA